MVLDKKATTHRCFIDDLSLLVRIDQEEHEDAELDGRVFEDDGRIKAYIEVIMEFCAWSGMKLNNEKTHAIPFDWSTRKMEFFPGCITFPNGDLVEVGESLKLLGLTLEANPTFKSFSKGRRRKGIFAMWKLKRLQASGISTIHLKAVYE